MAATTGQLGLVTPTQGTLTGTWGDTANNGITEYTNIAIAGTLTLTNDGAVTLANTTGDNSASNITSTLTGAGTVTAQFAIVRVTGTLTTAKVVTGPAYSKTYTVVNAATGGIVTFKASGQTGVSIAVGESAFVYYNGTDYVKVVGTATAGAAGGSTTQVQYNSSGVLAGSANMTFDGTSMTLGGNPTLSAGTANGVTYLNGSKVLTSGGALVFNGTNLGVGLTPNSIWSSAKAIQINSGMTLMADSLNAYISKNNYFNGTNWIYSTTGAASYYAQDTGTHQWHTAASGTAGNTISFTQAMTLDASGNLGIGTTSPTAIGASYGTIDIRGTNGGGINVGTTSTNTGSIYGNASGITIQANGATGLFFYSNSTERLRITSAGAWGLSGSNYGTSGQVLTSGGSAAAPTWTTVSGGGSAATPTALGTVYGLTGGTQATSLGYQAGASSPSYTTSVGYQAGYSSTATVNNYGSAYFGTKAGYTASTGTDNTFIGNYSGYLTTTGSNNIAVGGGALYSNTTSSNSVAIGYQALQQANVATSGFGGETVAIGYRAFYSLGTVASNSSGGCTAVGHAAGYSTTSAGNGANDTFIGYLAGYYNVSGYSCTFVGTQAGYGQTSGNNNTVVGYNAGRQTSGAGGGNCTFVGSGAGGNNSGNDNTFVGVSAGNANTGSGENAYFGTYAAQSCTGGSNVAIGKSAMYSATTANYNVAVGAQALYSQTSTTGYHTAVGYQSLYSSTDNSNAALGYRSGYGVTTGNNNTLLGINAGNGSVVLTGGAQNVVIGAGAYTNTAGAYTEIVIGAGCNGLGNDRVSIGKLNSRIWAQFDSSGSWTYSSDLRLKKDIEDDGLGLSFINKLRPVTYRWKATNELELDNPQYNEVNNKNTTVVMHGLIAQEVKAALDKEGVSTFAGWAVEPNGIQSVSREMFITPLINAVQELTAQINQLKADFEAYKTSHP